LVGTGIISKKIALDFGFTGPVLRGSGIPWDLRKVQPYECYPDLNFQIPISSSGDCYSRYLIRMIEMFESVKIIEQCCLKLLGQLPTQVMDHCIMNTCRIDSNHISDAVFDYNLYNFYYDSKFSMEELIFFFREYSDGYDVPHGCTYTVIEAPKGETGVLLMSDGSNKPYRCKIKAPGFLHLQGLDLISKGFLLADVVTNLGSLDIVFGEVDR
jgi:NADH-quinone oxidoreductase subunit D